MTILSTITYSGPDRNVATGQVICFGDEDPEGVIAPPQDPLVIMTEIGDPSFHVKRILIDNGSTVNVLFTSALQKMNIPSKRL